MVSIVQKNLNNSTGRVCMSLVPTGNVLSFSSIFLVTALFHVSLVVNDILNKRGKEVVQGTEREKVHLSFLMPAMPTMY